MAMLDPFYVPEGVFYAGRRKQVLVMPAPHVHSQIELNFMTKGGMTYAVQGRQIDVQAGDFVFFWGAVPHQTVAVRGSASFICIYVPLEMLLAMPLSARLIGAILAGGVLRAEQSPAFNPAQLQRLHAELLGPDARLVDLDRTELELILRRVDLTGWRDLCELAPAAGGAGVERRRRRRRAVAMAGFIAAHASEPISVNEIARAAGLHPNYAMSLFRQEFGVTINVFLTRQRLHRAQQLLAGGARSVASVAFDCGFGSLSRFHEAFAGHFGLPPGRFRRLARRAVLALPPGELAQPGRAV
jgi:AraC-like DNA-binding protein